MARFAAKVCPEPNTGCWLWTAQLMPGPWQYGRFTYRGREMLAHRASWEIHRGPIPRRMHVCHRCDTPSCVNPDHLFLGTHQDNMRDRDNKGRGYKGGYSRISRGTVSLALFLVEQGNSRKEVGAWLRVDPSSVWNWMTRKYRGTTTGRGGTTEGISRG